MDFSSMGKILDAEEAILEIDNNQGSTTLVRLLTNYRNSTEQYLERIQNHMIKTHPEAYTAMQFYLSQFGSGPNITSKHFADHRRDLAKASFLIAYALRRHYQENPNSGKESPQVRGQKHAGYSVGLPPPEGWSEI